jgi:threonine/homoserine/homoserine lactone efflux protein
MSDPLLYLAKGAVLGLSIAAPVGPIGVLFIRRTVADGFGAGFAGGLGTAAADAFYAALAAAGLTAVSTMLATHGTALRLVAAAMLLWLGVSAIRGAAATGSAAPREAAAMAEPRLAVSAAVPAAAATAWVPTFAQTFGLTLANPTTILSFAAIFGGLGLAETGAGGDAAALVVGVFAGSLAWWAALGGALSAARARITPRAVAWINRGSGAVLIGFAAAILLELLKAS